MAIPGRSPGNPFEYTPPENHPLNPGDYENTAAINPRKPAIPRQVLPQDHRNDIGFRRRIYSGPLRGQRDLGTVTTAALLMTFAATFDELGGVLGAIGGNRGGHEAESGSRLVGGKAEMNDGPTGDAGSFTVGSQARTR